MNDETACDIFGVSIRRSEPAPIDTDLCYECDDRPVYEHGRCKRCHDVALYRRNCGHCRRKR